MHLLPQITALVRRSWLAVTQAAGAYMLLRPPQLDLLSTIVLRSSKGATGGVKWVKSFIKLDLKHLYIYQTDKVPSPLLLSSLRPLLQSPPPPSPPRQFSDTCPGGQDQDDFPPG